MNMTDERLNEIKNNMDSMDLVELLRSIGEVAGDLYKRTGSKNFQRVSVFANTSADLHENAANDDIDADDVIAKALQKVDELDTNNAK